MTANILTFVKSITTVRTVEALPADDTTVEEMNMFLAGSGFHYYTPSSPGPGVVGYMTRQGAHLTIRTGEFVVKVNGEVSQILTADMLQERYGN